jgi:hypothetical protein
MTSSRLSLLAAAALGFAAASPAAALTGYKASGHLQVSGGISVAQSRSTTKNHTCQTGNTREKAAARSKLVGTARKTTVVACEQPPRSNMLPTLKQTAQNALTALG